jgi:hypothetical protein
LLSAWGFPVVCAIKLTRHVSRSTNIVIILGMMQVSKKIPFDDPNTLNIVRALYIASNLIIASLYLYTQLQINKKKGMHPDLPNFFCHDWRDILRAFRS